MERKCSKFFLATGICFVFLQTTPQIAQAADQPDYVTAVGKTFLGAAEIAFGSTLIYRALFPAEEDLLDVMSCVAPGHTHIGGTFNPYNLPRGDLEVLFPHFADVARSCFPDVSSCILEHTNGYTYALGLSRFVSLIGGTVLFIRGGVDFSNGIFDYLQCVYPSQAYAHQKKKDS